MSSVRTFEVDGREYVVNIGDPDLIKLVKNKAINEEEYRITFEEQLEAEKYDMAAGLVRDIIGDEQFNAAFEHGRDFFLLSDLLMAVSPLYVEISQKVVALFDD